jgi:hypothetical protein
MCIIWQSALRVYLGGHGVRVRSGATLPVSVEASLVMEYEDGSGMGPDIKDIALDWTSKLTSMWNRDTIHILAEDFLSRVKAGEFRAIAFDEQLMTLEYFKKLCTEKIAATRRTFLDYSPPEPGSQETAEQKANRVLTMRERSAVAARRNSRRVGVRSHPLSLQ